MSTISSQRFADTVLSDLVGNVQSFGDTVRTFLQRTGDTEILVPDMKLDFMSIDEPVPMEFFDKLGIRRLILNAFPGRRAITDHFLFEYNRARTGSPHWDDIKNEVLIEELEALFASCIVIQFTDWADKNTASDFWTGLLYDVIKPLPKKDFHFIFYLGDPTKRLVFETDEILDIVSEYATCGKVTTILYDNEADKLWEILNGWKVDAHQCAHDPKEAEDRYLSIYKALQVDTLVILSGTHAWLISNGGQFEFRINGSGKCSRDHFDAGYQLGLLLRLDAPQCVALALAISGAADESAPSPKALLHYIRAWIAELKTNEIPFNIGH